MERTEMAQLERRVSEEILARFPAGRPQPALPAPAPYRIEAGEPPALRGLSDVTMPVHQAHYSRPKTQPRNLPMMTAWAGYIAGGAGEDRNGRRMNLGGRVKTLEAA